MTPTANVSRETLTDLEQFHDLLVKWNARINLVSKSSISELWDRHIWDSAQIFDLVPTAQNWADLGSGGGFPALIVAIMSKHQAPKLNVLMIESDQRKSAFLRTVIRELGLNACVLTARIEDAAPARADVVSARALADLDTLLGYAQHHMLKSGKALFLKGETWENEVELARQTWSFELRVHPSKTSPEAAILEIEEIERVRSVPS